MKSSGSNPASRRIRRSPTKGQVIVEPEAAVEFIPALVACFDIEQRYVYCNGAYESWFGLAAESILGRTFADVVGDKVHGKAQPFIDRVMNGKAVTFESHFPYRLGPSRDVHVEYVPSISDDGRVNGWYSLTVDVTAQREAEKNLRSLATRLEQRVEQRTLQLQESLKLLQAIHDSSPDALLQLDADGTILSASNSSTKLFGRESKELLGRPLRDLLPGSCSEDFDDFYSRHRTAPANADNQDMTESYILKSDGTACPVEVALGDIPALGQCTAFIRDISRRRRLESELLSVATDERRRISLDLHDSLCQQISAIHFSLANVSNQLTSAGHELGPAVKRISQLAAAALDDARQIAHGLSPVMQDGDDVVRSIRRLVRNIEDLCQTQCRMHAAEVFEDLHPDVASQLYHIAQEALNNVVRHASATRIEVTLRKDGPDVVLTIGDDGVGLASIQKDDSGRGLRFMRYRASTVHGSLKIVRKKEGGTAVICRVPFSPA